MKYIYGWYDPRNMTLSELYLHFYFDILPDRKPE